MTEPKGFAARVADAIFSIRPLILLIFLLGSAVMAYSMLQLRVDAGFKKQLPLDHEYMQTFLDYEREFGGANRIMVALMARDGEMFTPEFIQAFEEVSNEVFLLPGVDRASVRSIFTPNVRFVEVVEDGFAGGNVIPADFEPSEEMFDRVRSNIIKSGEVGRLVAEDFSGAMVWANLLEEDPSTGETLDYQDVADRLEAIRTDYENEAHTVHIIGFAKIVGDVADGARGVVVYFGVAFAITAILLLLYSKSVWLTVLPLVCSTVAVIWQLGALSLLGFGIDPMNILTPFLVFAIGVSHGVQMISGWQAEKFFGGRSPAGLHHDGIDLGAIEIASSLDAAKATFARLLAPGSIALLSDTIGFLTILLINIRIIQELAITASIGVAIIIFTNLVLLPILLSYVRMRNGEKYRQRAFAKAATTSLIWRFVASFTRPGVAAVTIVAGVVLFAGALYKSQDMQIGDSEAGVPELRQDARYNQDARLISDRFSLGTDLISVIAETVPQACTENPEIMDAIDDFSWQMQQVEGVQQVISLPMAAKIINAGWNEGNLRWKVLPRNVFIMRQNLQNIETDSGLLNRDCSAMPIMIFTEDHKAETIARVVQRVKELRAEFAVDGLEFHGSGEVVEGLLEQDAPVCEEDVCFRLATGNVGVMAATNEEVRAAQTPMLLYVYGAIILLCLITFRSVRGTICIVLPLVLVSYMAYSLMAFMGIGLKVNTLPVVALGVGIGVDYGIYIYSRMAGHLKEGMSLDAAYMQTLRLTGKAVFFTAITLAVGVGTWLFSDLKFQADMGVLLAFMFIFNMIGAMLLLPALARWLLRPREAA
ncbi:RND family transporter [Wenzhouxiangella sp. XN79A]|uniref:efflux RND transporter permease subunit n=1 Tax=Wenzhouxiangella sp. XN79A TaxID=2724193 RepID=UPI00144A59B5|nr:MMPL family transporter [Wenzhouxiangella sp. XN79A]NKI36507.1 RND family transporter [Wenzhouxiangella sp. XN79A]